MLENLKVIEKYLQKVHVKGLENSFNSTLKSSGFFLQTTLFFKLKPIFEDMQGLASSAP